MCVYPCTSVHCRRWVPHSLTIEVDFSPRQPVLPIACNKLTEACNKLVVTPSGSFGLLAWDVGAVEASSLLAHSLRGHLLVMFHSFDLGLGRCSKRTKKKKLRLQPARPDAPFRVAAWMMIGVPEWDISVIQV